MSKIYDIWFQTELKLTQLGRELELKNIERDCENYWEWIIGYLDEYCLDITRTHTIKAAETDTRIFLIGKTYFTQSLIVRITEKLKTIGITPIYLGQWVYKSGDDFEKKEFQKLI